MSVLKTLTDEYFGENIRNEDTIDISGLDVEIVSFKDKNGRLHKNGFRVKNNNDANEMSKTLKELIERIIKVRGEECSLNVIDVSNIKEMCCKKDGNCYGIFYRSNFDGDISGWDVFNVIDMNNMFIQSKYTGKNGIFKLEKGNKVKNVGGMFYQSEFDGDISDWYVQNINCMTNMFAHSNFNGNIENWKLNDSCETFNMFGDTPLKQNGKLPHWYEDKTPDDGKSYI